MVLKLTRSDALQLGRRLHAAGDEERALTLYRQFVGRWPDEAEALNNLAVLLKRRSDYNGAAALLRNAIAIAPTVAGPLTNLGNVLRDSGDLLGAATCHRAAIRLDPDNPEHHVALSFVLLSLGQWGEGLEEYEWRDQRRKLAKAAAVTGKPLWDGGALEGRTILLQSEQGMGDTLHFVRYASAVAALGGRVLVRCQPDLIPLVRTVPGVADAFYDEDVHYDVQDLLMSLPWRLGTRPENIPADVPYVRADEEKVLAWRRRLGEPGGELRVGLIWAGNPAFSGDERRSPRLNAILPLLEVPGVRFFGLQMGDGRRDLDHVQMPAGFVDLGGMIQSCSDTAAIMENLDLVISSCTAPAHLAGALGRPLWMLLSYAADWRWLRDQADSPWYPSARLFRQPLPGDWRGPVDGMRKALEAWSAHHAA